MFLAKIASHFEFIGGYVYVGGIQRIGSYFYRIWGTVVDPVHTYGRLFLPN